MQASRQYRGSIRRRLMAMILLVVMITGVVGYSTFLGWYMANQQQRMLAAAQTVGMVLSQDFARLTLLDDVAVAADISAKLSSFDALQAMVLYNQAAEPVYQFRIEGHARTPSPLPVDTERTPQRRGDLLTLYLPATYQGIDLGTVRFEFQVRGIGQLLQRDLPALGAIALIMMGLSFVLAALFSRRFTRPILQLVNFLDRVDSGALLNQRIRSQENNEFGKLCDKVNAMLERIESSQQAMRLAAVAFETSNGMLITDAKQRILQVNRAFTETTGYAAADVLGRTPAILKSGRHDATFYANMYRALREHRFWSGEIWNLHANGKIHPERLTIQSVLDENQQVIYYVAAFIDLSRQKAAELRIQYLSQHDALTGLANRRHLTDRLQESLSSPRSEYGALFCFDLKDFKVINDTLGHEVGDELLLRIAERLRDTMDSSDLIARLGADEFVLWHQQLSNEPEQAALDAEQLAEILLMHLMPAFDVDERALHITPCIGIRLIAPDAEDAATLLQQADLALHQAKQQDGRALAFFEVQAQDLARHYLEINAGLRQALEYNQLCLHYQPQIDRAGQVVGAEALIRWQHPERGLLSPVEFIPAAERSGQIVALGTWVLESACRQLACWQTQPILCDWSLAVNVSVRQFQQADFVRTVEEVLQRHRVNPQQLKLELTESLLVDNLAAVIDKMQALRALGVKLSLDDFGTGYASLTYLRHLPLNQIKIDRSFVAGLLSGEQDEAIITSVIALGKAFNFEVIAEGVETPEQHQRLTALGCDAFQGYLIGMPQTAEALSQLQPVLSFEQSYQCYRNQ